MAKELCLTPGGPASEAMNEAEAERSQVRQKKRNDRESAEAIIPGALNRKGPNVVTMRIAVSKA